MKATFIEADKLSQIHKTALERLNKECFGDVDPQEVVENFIAEPFGYLFAVESNQIIARLALFSRIVKFENLTIKLGGMGGVCVSERFRHRGVASQLLKEGIKILAEQGCDIACLNVDLDKKIYSLYEKLGFQMMDREITFENVRGGIIRERGTMFHPLNSPAKFNLIMNSPETFHYGRGYW